MNKLIEIQIPIVEFFQKLSSGNLYILWTCLSTIICACAFLVFINYYWNIDKNDGYNFGVSLFISFFINNLIKAIFCIERPYIMDSRIIKREIGPFGSGKSFPSSHVALTSASFTSSILTHPIPTKYIYYSILIVILMISRMALGMHYPIDVVSGLIIGILSSIIFYKYSHILKRVFIKFKYLSLYISILLLFISFALTISTICLNLNQEIYSDIAGSLSLMSSIKISRCFENKYVKFITRARKAKKVLRIIVGLIPVGCIVFFLSFTNIIVSKTIMPFIAVFWIIFLYPYIGTKINLFNLR